MGGALHEEAMRLDDAARVAQTEGRTECAQSRFSRAAESEERAADSVPTDQPRTRGILCISAVSMWREAGEIARARALAQRYLDEGLSPGFARELRELLATMEDV